MRGVLLGIDGLGERLAHQAAIAGHAWCAGLGSRGQQGGQLQQATQAVHQQQQGTL